MKSLVLGLAILLVLSQVSSAFNIRTPSKTQKSSGRNINGNAQNPNSAIPLRPDPDEDMEWHHGEGDFDPEHDGEMEYGDGDEEPEHPLFSSTPSTTLTTTPKAGTTTVKFYPSKTKPTKRASSKPKKPTQSVSRNNVPPMTKPIKKSSPSIPAVSSNVKPKVPEVQKEPIEVPSAEDHEFERQKIVTSSTPTPTISQSDINKLYLGDSGNQQEKDLASEVKKPDQISKRMGEGDEDFEFEFESDEEPLPNSPSSSNSKPIVVPSGQPWNNEDNIDIGDSSRNQTSNEGPPHRIDTTQSVQNFGAEGTKTNQQGNGLPWSSLYGPPPFASQIANLHSGASHSGEVNSNNNANIDPNKVLLVPPFLQKQNGDSAPKSELQHRHYPHSQSAPWNRPSHSDANPMRRNNPYHSHSSSSQENKNLYGANIHLDGATFNSKGMSPVEDRARENANWRDRTSMNLPGVRIEFPHGAPTQVNDGNYVKNPPRRPTWQNTWNTENSRSDFSDDYQNYDSLENGNKDFGFNSWRRNDNGQFPSSGTNRFENMNFRNPNKNVNNRNRNNWNPFGPATPTGGNRNDFWMNMMMNPYQSFGITPFHQNPMTNQFYKRSGNSNSNPYLQWQLRRAAMMNMMNAYYNSMIMNPYYAMMMGGGGGGMNPTIWNYFRSIMQNMQQSQNQNDFMSDRDPMSQSEGPDYKKKRSMKKVE